MIQGMSSENKTSIGQVFIVSVIAVKIQQPLDHFQLLTHTQPGLPGLPGLLTLLAHQLARTQRAKLVASPIGLASTSLRSQPSQPSQCNQPSHSQLSNPASPPMPSDPNSRDSPTNQDQALSQAVHSYVAHCPSHRSRGPTSLMQHHPFPATHRRMP